MTVETEDASDDSQSSSSSSEEEPKKKKKKKEIKVNKESKLEKLHAIKDDLVEGDEHMTISRNRFKLMMELLK